MFKIFGKSIIIIIIYFAYSFAYSNFEITEIMYDLDGADTNREWIEVKNTGESTLDLSKWFFFSDNTKHALVPQEESSILSNDYAVIVQNVLQFKNDWPNFRGQIFDSSWTGFKNSGEAISLRDPDLNIVSPVNFSSNQGGAGDGYSLQRINGEWVGSKPTPGKENIFTKKVAPTINSVAKKDEDIKEIKKIDEIEEKNFLEIQDKNEIINLNNIKEKAQKNKIPISVYPYVGLVVVIGMGITSFLIFKKRTKEEGGIGEKLTAKDFKIIE